MRADVRHETMSALVDRTVARFGRLDVAVNNAGTEGKPGPVTEQTAESYARHLRHQRARRAAEHEARAARHAAAEAGSIVNVSSVAGPGGFAGASRLRGQQARGRRADEVGGARGGRRSACASTRSRPARSRPACWTGSPAPPTGRPALVAGVPLKRAGTPEEIAQAIVFIASDKASFITGQVIDVNGGKTAM